MEIACPEPIKKRGGPPDKPVSIKNALFFSRRCHPQSLGAIKSVERLPQNPSVVFDLDLSVGVNGWSRSVPALSPIEYHLGLPSCQLIPPYCDLKATACRDCYLRLSVMLFRCTTADTSAKASSGDRAAGSPSFSFSFSMPNRSDKLKLWFAKPFGVVWQTQRKRFRNGLRKESPKVARNASYAKMAVVTSGLAGMSASARQ